MSLSLLFWIALFIGGYILIYFAADGFIDELKNLSKFLKISSFLIGLFILGIDPEESIASIVASINGLPYVAVGNVIGNNIIALSLCFGLPALFYKVKFDNISGFYPVLMIIGILTIFIGFFIPSYNLLIIGTINVAIFLIYMGKNLIKYKKSHTVDIIIEDLEDDEDDDDNENELNNKINSKLESKEDIANDKKNFQSSTLQTEKKNKFSKRKKELIYLGKAAFFFLLIVLGGEILITATDNLITLTHIDQSFFGFIIIAFVTNVEEITLIIKAVQKGETNIGIGGMIGKLIWNFGITFGISGIIIQSIKYNLPLIVNSFILLGLIIYLTLLLKTKKISRLHGVILLIVFVFFVTLNIFIA